ncbi:MAG: TraV family lipoprotein [Alphaproteobacteria bacterium]|nr:TraV family lipoprotein [Alphaproteobacteria bacterium]
MTRLAPILLILSLAGCAAGNPNVSGQWDCPAQQGLACATIGEADARADTAIHITPLAPPSEVFSSAAPPSPGAAVLGGDASALPEALPVGTVGGAIPSAHVRETEVLAKVWFYPFVDGGGHYHEGGFVHVVMRPADWRIAPEHLFPVLPEPATGNDQSETETP